MASTTMPLDQTLTDKLALLAVNVAEVEPESPQAEVERLTMQSPLYAPSAINVIRCPPEDTYHLRPSSPSGSVRSSFSSFSSHRRVNRRSHSHRRAGFLRSYRSEVSKELTSQAESEFHALVELMSGISRRSTSLREIWTKIISERESYTCEIERLCEQVDEFTETIERHEHEKHSHSHEHEEQKKVISKLQAELSIAMASSTEIKKKLHDRDCELGKVRGEVAELKDVYSYLKQEHEETKTTLEETQNLLVASQQACRSAEDDAKKHHGELEDLGLKYAELQSSCTETTTTLESARKEVTALKQSVSSYKKEQHDWLHARSEFEDRLRRCHNHEEELKRKVKELTESYEKKKHEFTETLEKKNHENHEVKEKLSKARHEKEELHEKVKKLEAELHEKHCHWDDAEERCGKWKLKWEDCHCECTTITENYQRIEMECTELRNTVTTKTEEHRTLLIEKKRFEKDFHDKSKECKDLHRDVVVLRDSVRRFESTVKEKIELIHTLHERIERVERERDEAHSQREDLEAELSSLNSIVIALKIDIETMTAERDSIREKCHEFECKYEEVCVLIEDHQSGQTDFEHEMFDLRGMLREARDEREKAISMRISADRERDEATARFESKCREMDKLEERLAQAVRDHGHHHGRHKAGGKILYRSASSTTAVVKSDTE